MNPLNSVGIVGLLKGEGRYAEVENLGSCFPFRQRTTFLTAQHCIPDDALPTGLLMPGAPEPIRFASADHHPDADLSLLTVDPHAMGYPAYWEPFWNFVGNWAVGEEFVAYGYPVDTLVDEDPGPKPRLFRGHYQRFWFHRAGPRFRYLAGELSIPEPTGLSGGPVFRPGAPEMLTGMVTANVDSTTYADEVEERSRDGVTVERTVLKRIVSYGVAVMLSGLAEWLDERVPAHVPQRPAPPAF